MSLINTGLDSAISIAERRRGNGVAFKLMERAIGVCREQGYSAVILVGDHEYYERFGFRNIPGLEPLIPSDAPYFRAQSLFGPEPQGRLRYAPAFD